MSQESRREYNRLWRERNPDYHRQYNEQNREARAARAKEYRKETAAERAEYNRNWHAENPQWQSEYYPKYRAENPSVPRAADRKRRASVRGLFVENPTDEEILARTEGLCHLCLKSIDLSVSRTEPNGLHVDHVIGISLGGPHALGNLAASHARCNLQKPKALAVSASEDIMLAALSTYRDFHGKDYTP